MQSCQSIDRRRCWSWTSYHHLAHQENSSPSTGKLVSAGIISYGTHLLGAVLLRVTPGWGLLMAGPMLGWCLALGCLIVTGDSGSSTDGCAAWSEGGLVAVFTVLERSWLPAEGLLGLDHASLATLCPGWTKVLHTDKNIKQEQKRA